MSNLALNPYYGKSFYPGKLVKNTNLTRLQSLSGLFEYANYLEHLLENAQDIQRYLKASEERNFEKFKKIVKLENELNLLRKDYDVKQIEKDKRDLAKARMRIRKAKAQQYYYLMAGVSYGIRVGDLGKAMYGLQTDYPVIQKNIEKYYDNNYGEQQTLLRGSYLRKPNKKN